jgi:hypothetical protein
MEATVFCYCCRVHHARERMQLYPTRTGLRWRCRESIRIAGASVAMRDAAGRRQTTWNQHADSQRSSLKPAMHDEDSRRTG